MKRFFVICCLLSAVISPELLFSADIPDRTYIGFLYERHSLDMGIYGFDGLDRNNDHEYGYDNVNVLGLSVCRNGLQFSFVSDIPVANFSGKKTEINDYAVDYFTEKFGFEAYYRRYAEMTLSTYDSLGLDKDDPRTDRTDIEATRTGISVYFCFLDHNGYSLRKGFQRKGVHEKFISASVFLSVAMQHSSVKGTYPLVVDSAVNDFKGFGGFKVADLYFLNTGPGIGISFSYKKFYFSPVIVSGFGLEYIDFRPSDSDYVHFDFTCFKVSAPAGFEGDSLFFSFRPEFDYSSFYAAEEGSFFPDLLEGNALSFRYLKLEFTAGVKL